MYNPTNTRCQILSYKDLGAPTLTANNRDALFPWLDTIFSSGYNLQNVLSITSNGTQITINFNNSTFGYTLGQLIKVTGASEAVFNKKWRVQSVHETSVKCNIVDSDTYPTTATGTISSTTASLDWEFVYSDVNQRSIRSKMNNSSKSIITFKKPTGSLLKDKNSVVYEIEVSKNINTSNGFIIDSLTSPYNFNDSSLSVSSFYFIQCVYGTSNIINPSNNTYIPNQSYALPWHVIGDGRIFYIIIGNQTVATSSSTNNINEINAELSNTYNITRASYFFGDYDSFNEQNTINGNELVINFPQYFNNLYTRSDFDEQVLGNFTFKSIYALKTYIGTASKDILRPNSVGAKSTFSNFTSANNINNTPFPNPGVNGYILFPVYLQDSMNNYRGSLPYVKHIPQTSSYINNNNTPLSSIYDRREVLDNGEIFTMIPLVASSTSNYTYVTTSFFSLGI